MSGHVSRYVDHSVTVLVPATSANLGPGYDTLGLALDLHDRVTAEVIESGLEIVVSGEGADTVVRDDSHLIVRSLRAGLDLVAATLDVVLPPLPGLRLTCENHIPHARGLGSSSAAIVAGLALARLLVEGGEAVSADALFRVAAQIEGHPDNVAPAVYGGLTISGEVPDGFISVQAPIDSRISAVVFIPAGGVATKVARGLIPATVPHAEAAQNTGNAALLIAALAGQPEHLLRATQDFLHQGYRRPAMPESLALVDQLRDLGVPAVVSGAGPTVLALVVDGDDSLARSCAPTGWEVRTLQVGGGVAADMPTA